jgi:hypothetical protein
MIQQLLTKNRVAQRAAAIKDLLMEKIDKLNEKLDLILARLTDKLSDFPAQVKQENAKILNNTNVLLENNAFLLKFAVDIVKSIQESTAEVKAIRALVEELSRQANDQKQ